jgi:hypothetical protein
MACFTNGGPTTWMGIHTFGLRADMVGYSPVSTSQCLMDVSFWSCLDRRLFWGVLQMIGLPQMGIHKIIFQETL